MHTYAVITAHEYIKLQHSQMYIVFALANNRFRKLPNNWKIWMKQLQLVQFISITSLWYGNKVHLHRYSTLSMIHDSCTENRKQKWFYDDENWNSDESKYMYNLTNEILCAANGNIICNRILDCVVCLLLQFMECERMRCGGGRGNDCGRMVNLV